MDALKRRGGAGRVAESAPPSYGREFVVDASVAFKWVVPEEPDLAAAQALGEGLRDGRLNLYAPDLILLELANALRYSRRPLVRDPQLLLHEFFAISLQMVRPDAALVGAAMSLALKRDLTVYDALCCALADQLEIPLITADEKLVRKLPKWGRFQPLRTFTPSGEA